MKPYFRAVAVAAAAAALILMGPSSARSGDQMNFTAHLAGENEVPPVDTNATGQATFKLSDDGTELHYKLIVANIHDVVQSHIHLAPEGVNGPVVAFLFGPSAVEGRRQGVIAQGVITQANLIPRPAIGFGGTMAELVAAMRNGGAYVNAHTHAVPSGEIRGQIK